MNAIARSRSFHGLAAVLLVSAAALTEGRPVTARSATDAARALVRPVLLPSAWARQRTAWRSGDAELLLAEGRVLADLLPEWADGQVQVAWHLAYDLADERDPAAAADLVLRAADLLVARAEQSRELGDHMAAAELTLTAASIVEDRSHRSDELGEALRLRLGAAPDEFIGGLLQRAVLDRDSLTTRGRLAFFSARLVGGRLQLGDLPGAELTRRTAIRRLAALDPATGAPTTLQTLETLGDLRRLREDPAQRHRLLADPAAAELLGAGALATIRDLDRDTGTTGGGGR